MKKISKKWNKLLSAGISLCAVSSGFIPEQVKAQAPANDQTWNGNTNSNWSTNTFDANWDDFFTTGNVGWTNGNNAIFNPVNPGTITILAGVDVNDITVNEDGFTFAGVALNAFTGDLIIADEKTLILTGDTFSGHDLKLTGQGTLDLQGVSTANSIDLVADSNLILNGNYNQIAGLPNSGSISGVGSVNLGTASATLGNLSASSVNLNNQNLTVNGTTNVADFNLGSGDLTLNGTADVTTINFGTGHLIVNNTINITDLNVGAGNFSLNGTANIENLNLGANNITLNGIANIENLNLGTANLNLNGTTNLTNINLGNGDLTLSGVSTITNIISGNGNIDIDSTVTFNGANTFTGDVFIDHGATLTITNNQALGLGDGFTSIAGIDNNTIPNLPAGTLNLTNGLTINESIGLDNGANLNIQGNVRIGDNDLLNAPSVNGSDLSSFDGSANINIAANSQLVLTGDLESFNDSEFMITGDVSNPFDFIIQGGNLNAATICLNNAHVLIDATALPSSLNRNTAIPVILDGDINNNDNFILKGSSKITLTGSASANFTENAALAGARTHSSLLYNENDLDFLDRNGDNISDQAIEDFVTLAGSITIEGTNIDSDIISTAGENNITGAINLQEDGQIEVQSGYLTLAGNINGLAEIPVVANDILESITFVAGANAQLNIQGQVGNIINAAISRTGNVNILGVGRVELNGNNNYAGITTLQAGALLAANTNSALGAAGDAINGNTLVSNGATLTLGEQNGILIDALENTESNYLNDLNITENTIILNGTGRNNLGALHRGGGLAAGASINNLEIATDASININDDQQNPADAVTQGLAQLTSLIVNGSLTGAGNLTKQGDGVLTLTQDSSGSYTGEITVANGVLKIENNGALGSANTGTTINNGATLLLDNGLELIEQNIAINGQGVQTEVNDAMVANSNEGALHLLSTAGVQTSSTVNNLTLQSDATLFIETNGEGYSTTTTGLNRLIINGQLSGVGNLEIIGGGALEISQNSTLTGDINLKKGQLIARAEGSLGTGTVSAESLGLLAFALTNDADGTFANNINLNGGTLYNQGGDNRLTGILNLGNPTEISDADGNVIFVDHLDFYDQATPPETASHSLSLTTITGTTGFTKTGEDLLIIEGDNNYAGLTIVENGNLHVTHANALGDFTNLATDGTFINGVNSILQLSGGIALSEGVELNDNTSLRSALENTQGAFISAGDNSLLRELRVNATTAVNIDTVHEDDTLTLAGGITGTGTLRVNTLQDSNGTVRISAPITGVANLILGNGNSTTSAIEFLTINQHQTTTINGATVTLGASNALGTGLTRIQADSTLQTAAVNNAIELDNNIQLDANLVIENNNDLVLNGIINGAADKILRKRGSGNVRIENLSNFSGELSIEHTAVATVPPTTPIIPTTTLAGEAAITQLNITNGNTLNVENANSFTAQNNNNTLNATINGTLSLAGSEQIQAVQGSGNIIINNGDLSVNEGNFAGSISGAGNLVKTGTSNLTLTGASNHTGNTSINAGSLTLSGQGALTATSTVNISGGTLLLEQGNNQRLSDQAVVNVSNGGQLIVNNTEVIGSIDLDLIGVSGTGVLIAENYTLKNGTTVAGNLGNGTGIINVEDEVIIQSETAHINVESVNIGTDATLTLGQAPAQEEENPQNDLIANTTNFTVNGELALLNNETIGNLRAETASITGQGLLQSSNINATTSTFASSVRAGSVTAANSQFNASVSTFQENGSTGDLILRDSTVALNLEAAGNLLMERSNVNGTILVGNGEFNQINSGVATLTNANVSGDVNAFSVTSTNSTFNGNLSAINAANVTGGTINGNLTAQTLNLSNSQIQGNVFVGSTGGNSSANGAASITNSTINGTLQAGDLTNRNVIYNGAVTLDSATVEAAQFNSTLTANQVTISGISSIAGDVTVQNNLTVNNGTLTTRGSVEAGTIQINADAVWEFFGPAIRSNRVQGSGIVRGDVINLSTFAPSGTLTIEGNYTERGTLELNTATNDKLVVTGILSLDRDLARLQINDGENGNENNRLRVIEAGQGITGGFSNIATTSGKTLVFDVATGDVVTLEKSNTQGLNANSKNLYNSITEAALTGVNFDSSTQAGQAFDILLLQGAVNDSDLFINLSPEQYATSMDYALHSTRNFTRNVRSATPLTSIIGGGASSSTRRALDLPENLNLELLAGYNYLSVDSNPSAINGNFELEGHGAYLGFRINERKGRYSIGTFVGFDDSQVSARSLELEGDGIVWGAFANYKPLENMPLNLWAEASYGSFDLEGKRGNFSSNLNSSALQLGTGGDYTVYNNKGFHIAPAWGLRYQQGKMHAFNESGNALALSVDAAKDDALLLDLGVNLRYKAENTPFGASAYLGYQHDFYDNDRTVKASYTGGNQFAVNTAGIDSEAFIYSIGVHYDITNGSRIRLSYSGEERDDADSYSSLNLNYSIGF